MASAPTSDTSRNRPRVNRVVRACDYCRKKRLKCTPDKHPCLNCQLYGAECTSRDGPRGRTAQSTRRNVGHMHTPTSVETTNNTSTNSSISTRSAKTPTVSDDGPGTRLWSAGICNEEEVYHNDVGNLIYDCEAESAPNLWDFDETMFAGLQDVSVPHGNDQTSGDSEAASSGQTAGSFQLFDSLTNGYSGSINARDSAGEELMDDISSSMTKCDGDIQVLGPAELLVTQNGKQSVHIGINSSGATIASCVDDASKAQVTVAQPNIADFLIELNHYGNEAGVSLPPAPLCQLPAQQIAFECVEGYCRKVNTYYPIVDEAKIRQSLSMMYSEARDQFGALDHCLCYLVISIGSLMNPRSTEHTKITADLYREAWSMLQDCISSPSELSLQIVLLHVVHYMAVAKAGIAWTYSGLAVRIAQSLGLDRCPPQTSLTSSQSKDLWWIALSFDATLSMSQGRPPAVAKIDLSFSKTPGDLERTENGSLLPSFSHIYSWIFQIHTFQNEFCNMIQGKESSAWKLSQIAKFDLDLVRWKDSLPVECRPENLILVSAERYEHILYIHLEYFNMLRSIHWLATKLAPSTPVEAQAVLSGRLNASKAICLEAARSLIKTLNEHNNASDGSNWKTCAIVFQVSNYMAAIATLYWSISIEPKSLSARADLELLRAGTIHLERDTPNNVAGPGIDGMIDNLVIKANDLVWNGESR